jgi:hypothetical protein
MAKNKRIERAETKAITMKMKKKQIDDSLRGRGCDDKRGDDEIVVYEFVNWVLLIWGKLFGDFFLGD